MATVFQVAGVMPMTPHRGIQHTCYTGTVCERSKLAIIVAGLIIALTERVCPDCHQRNRIVASHYSACRS